MLHVVCKFWGICLKPFLTYCIPLLTTVPLQRTKLVVNAAIVFRRLGFTFSFSSITWFRVFNWRRRIFRAEKRSAQASAHPSVAGSRRAFLCVWPFVCVVLREFWLRLNEKTRCKPQLVIKLYSYITGKKNNATSSPGLLVNGAQEPIIDRLLRCLNLVKHKIFPNLVISNWLWWIKRVLLANQNRENILNE